MRARTANIKTPDEVLTLARYESKLNQIEEMTLFTSLKEYAEHVDFGKIKPDCKVFINSIADQSIALDKLDLLETLYRPYLKNVVIELTEEEKIDEAALQIKKQKVNEWKASIAIDDFGSGYNNCLLYTSRCV